MSDWYLDHKLLRELENGALAEYLRSQQGKYREDEITKEIAAAVKHESVPPDAYGIWLSVAKTPGPIASALRQTHSRLVRRHGIKLFGKKLKASNWESVWNEIGKVEGLISFLAQLPVTDVKLFCSVVGRCGNAAKIRKREESIEELLCSLLPSLFPQSVLRSHDKRPLDRYYIKLSPACSADFVETLLDRTAYLRSWELPLDQLTASFSGLFRQYATRDIFKNLAFHFDVWDYLPPLLERYPAKKGDHGFSASMMFSAEVIERLVDNENAKFPPSLFLPNLVGPLLRRAVKRKVDYGWLENIVSKALTYVEAHQECRAALFSGTSVLQTSITALWSRRAGLFEKHLVSSLGLSDQTNDLRAYNQLAREVPPSRRYCLLRLYCLHVPKLHIDIDDDAQLALLPRGLWNFGHFSSLPHGKGLVLLRRLVQFRPEGDFLEPSHGETVYSYRAHGKTHPDPNLLLSYMEHSLLGPATEQQGFQPVDEHRTLSIRSRDQEDRAFHVKAAIFHAIASGSLEIYHDVLLWSQRFIRDYLTMKNLFAENTVKQCSRLLAMPSPLNAQADAINLREHVCKANKILLTYLEMACLALREPSFKPSDCRGPLSLFGWVVNDRADCLDFLNSSGRFLGMDPHNAVWEDTIETLLEAEKTGHQPGHEDLDFHRVGGPLSLTKTTRSPWKAFHYSFYRFLDNLAQKRDQLWQEIRPRINPEVTALPPPWPRGLPIQYLVPSYNVAHNAAHGHMPFLAARSAAVISIPQRLAMAPIPQDSNVLDAIGPFVDSFKFALQVQVQQQPLGAARSALLSESWSHAYENLTFGRMNDVDSWRFWWDVFRQAVPVDVYELPRKDTFPESPLLPEDLDLQKAEEWNPEDGRPVKEDSRKLQPAIIDCLLLAPLWPHATDKGFDVPVLTTVAYDPPSVWSIQPSKRSQEGIIASAALYIDSKRSKDLGRRMLSAPFPSSEDVRYPPLFLDADFLMRRDLDEGYALSCLSSVLQRAPPSFLTQLTVSLLNELSHTQPESPRISSLEQTAYGALRLLSACDNPKLAMNLVVRTILDRPDASSWHRHLLTKTFLRRLGPSQAKATFTDFATGIQERLEGPTPRQQKQQEQDTPEGYRAMKPFVKVTTVKFLAQILDDANFISVADTIDVLVRILETASHIDIQIEVINAIFATISQNEKDSEGLIDRVTKAFERLVPVMSGLDERLQINEKAWLEAEQSNKVPFIAQDDVGLPPLLEVFVSTASNHSVSKEVRYAITRRIILPTLKRSTDNHTRWLRIFLSLCGYSPERLHFPSIPVKVRLLPRLLVDSIFVSLPASVFSLYHEYVQYLIRPPDGLPDLLDRVKSDPSLRHSNAGKHFLSMFDENPSSLYSIARLITHRFPVVEVTDGTSISQVQDYFTQQCSSSLQLSDPLFRTWQQLVRQLQPPFPFQSSQPLNVNTAWQQNARPVLETIISEVESFRFSSAWQSDPQRAPVFLPRTFHLRLWLLPYAALDSGKTSIALCEEYATLIALELRQLVARGIAAHLEDYEDITAAVMRLQDWDWKVYVGSRLGDLSSKEPSPAENLGVRLAVKLLAGVTKNKVREEHRATIQQMCRQWEECSDEGVRLEGWRMQASLLN